MLATELRFDLTNPACALDPWHPAPQAGPAFPLLAKLTPNRAQGIVVFAESKLD
jgi:hypothetical protein